MDDEGVPTDGIASFHTRRSMQSRRSIDPHRQSTSSIYVSRQGDREGLIRAYELENGGLGLSNLTEESDGEPGPTLKRSQELERNSQRIKHDD